MAAVISLFGQQAVRQAVHRLVEHGAEHVHRYRLADAHGEHGQGQVAEGLLVGHSEAGETVARPHDGAHYHGVQDHGEADCQPVAGGLDPGLFVAHLVGEICRGKGGQRAEDHVPYGAAADQVGDQAADEQAGHRFGHKQGQHAQRLGKPELYGARTEGIHHVRAREVDRGDDRRAGNVGYGVFAILHWVKYGSAFSRPISFFLVLFKDRMDLELSVVYSVPGRRGKYIVSCRHCEAPKEPWQSASFRWHWILPQHIAN